MRSTQAFELLKEKKFADAATSASRALELSKRVCGPDSVATAKCHRLLYLISLCEFSAVPNDENMASQTQAHLQDTLRVGEILLKKYSPLATPDQWQILADQAVKMKPGAAPILEQQRERCVLAAIEELDGNPDPAAVVLAISGDMLDRALFLSGKGDLQEAESLIRRAMNIPVASNAGVRNLFSALTSLSLVAVLEQQGTFDEIGELLELADSVLTDKSAFGRQSDMGVAIATTRGGHEVAKGNYDIAEELLLNAINVHNDLKAPQGIASMPVIAQAWISLAICSLCKDDPAAAESQYEKGVKIFKSLVAAESPELKAAEEELAFIKQWHSPREWRAATGNFSRQGRLIRVGEEGVILIQGDNAVVSTVNGDQLCEEDVDFVLRYLEASQEEDQDPFVDHPIP